MNMGHPNFSFCFLITKCFVSLLNHMAAVHSADRQGLSVSKLIKRKPCLNNIYTLCNKVFPIPINCSVTLDRCVKDHSLRWQTSDLFSLHSVLKKRSACFGHPSHFTLRKLFSVKTLWSHSFSFIHCSWFTSDKRHIKHTHTLFGSNVLPPPFSEKQRGENTNKQTEENISHTHTLKHTIEENLQTNRHASSRLISGGRRLFWRSALGRIITAWLLVKPEIFTMDDVYSPVKQQQASVGCLKALHTESRVCGWVVLMTTWGTEVQFDTVQPEWPGVVYAVVEKGIDTQWCGHQLRHFHAVGARVQALL